MINAIIVLFGLTMLYTAATSRLEAYIKMLSLQGFLLFLLIILEVHNVFNVQFLFLCIETLGFKMVAIPLILMHVVRKNGIFREVEPYLSNFHSLAIASLIFAAGFFVAYLAAVSGQNIKPFYFGISISTMITGLFVIMTRKKIITHIMGYMMLENGIFLLSLSIAREMPLIVNLGMLLDIFIAVFLLAVIVNRVKSTIEEVNVDKLTELKD